MSRLIDANSLIDVIKNIQDHMREVNKKPVPVDAREIFTLFSEMVEKQSTAYDLEEVLKQLEEMKPDIECFDNEEDYEYARTRHHKYVQIVRNGGVK